MGKKSGFDKQFHRVQIGRAQRFIRIHSAQTLSLPRIAKEAGASPFHFDRIFLAHTGETPFEFLRRIRLTSAVRMLQEDPQGPITEIALGVGYETPSAFNKVFKKTLGLSPREFRNLGQERQSHLLYLLSKPTGTKELEMKLNLSAKPEVVTWPGGHYIYVERTGPFAEVAPPAWMEMFPLVGSLVQDPQAKFIGLSTIDKDKKGEEAMVYEAGILLPKPPAKLAKGLSHKQMKTGKYACWRLKGPYQQIWVAFSQIFRDLPQTRLVLREGFCIENYLNDPKRTPESELLTELLVPVA